MWHANDVIEGVRARYWHRLDDGRIQCDVCPRYCRLHDGQRGLCFVRARRGEELVLTTYGRSSGFCIDPIEKKPLNHFLPGTPVLSFGTAGCNLACKFCQNWDISQGARDRHACRTQATPEAIARRGRAQRLPQRRVHLQRPGDLRGVRDRRRRGLPRARDQERRGHGRLHVRGAARRVLRAHGRRQRRPQGVHRELLSRSSARARCSRCSRRSSTSSTRPTSGSRSRRS